MHDLVLLFLGPFFEHHELLAELEQALAEADAFIAVQDLPDEELLVASLITSLLLFRIDLLGRLFCV